jgi:protein-S-isoprenylcysteine O-methyltransferase Ste14
LKRVISRLVADTVLVALMLFVSAGALTWWRAWILLGVMLTIRVIGALAVQRVNPALLQERAKLPVHAEQSWSDRLLVLAVLATGFLGLPLLAGLDVFQWHVSAKPTQLVSGIGLGLFALGWIIKNLALRANAFATVAVCLQSERSHAVAESGPYSIVRHPFYAADPLIFVGLALWLESYLAVVCAIAPVAMMVLRLHLEERFLLRELPGYREYTTRVPHRLIPRVW